MWDDVIWYDVLHIIYHISYIIYHISYIVCRKSHIIYHKTWYDMIWYDTIWSLSICNYTQWNDTILRNHAEIQSSSDCQSLWNYGWCIYTDLFPSPPFMDNRYNIIVGTLVIKHGKGHSPVRWFFVIQRSKGCSDCSDFQLSGQISLPGHDLVTYVFGLTITGGFL